jgi:hypothetical protein
LAPDSVTHELVTLCGVLLVNMILHEACVLLYHHRALRIPYFLPDLIPLTRRLSLPAHHLLLPVVDILIHLLLDFHVLLEYIYL